MRLRQVTSNIRHITVISAISSLVLVPFIECSKASSYGAESGPSPGELDQVPFMPPSLGLPPEPATPPQEHEFTLRHIFHRGTYLDPKLHKRIDIPSDATVRLSADDAISLSGVSVPLRAWSHPTKMQRLADRRPEKVEPLVALSRQRGYISALSPTLWTLDEISGPNFTDKETVVTLARMAADAYVKEPNTGEWEDVNGGFNYSQSFGWQGDGLRGHIFADKDNSTIVIGLKGTSPAIFDGAETTANDKINDNLFFSCCCAQGGQYLWKQVCDCGTSTYICNSTCLVENLQLENRYYRASLDLYSNVTKLYPNSNVWVTGHSLGGAVSSLLGLTYGLPVATFEAPAEALAASRVGIPLPPGSDGRYSGTYHYGHDADPIFAGTCNTYSSACTLGGYAFEAVCHTGKICSYNVTGDKGWRPGVGLHRIHQVIDIIQSYDEVAKCESEDPECVDCVGKWKFYKSNGSEITTTSSTTTTSSSTSSKTRTRTSTCKTPGWWGCLDESTTTTSTTSTSTSTTTTTSTTTCKTPGWFGCNDPTTTTTTTTTSSTSPPASPQPAPTVTTTSSLPTTSAQPTITSTPSAPSSSSSTTSTCTSKEWFGLICVDPSPTSTSTASPTRSSPPSRSHHRCRRKSWFGWCKEWEGDGEGLEGLSRWEI